MANRTRQRLGVAVVAAALAVAVIGVVNVRANPSPDLPPIAADRLLASSLEALSRPFTISGDVQTHVDVGIPQLPGSLGGVAGPVSLVIGDQRYRVWRSPEGARVAHLLDFREQDLVANLHEAWLWDSQDMTAVHVAFPTGASASPPTPAPGDFPTLAREALQAVAPYADVSVDGTTVVAGRPSYELVLVPRSSLTRIGRISVVIDAGTRLPLRFQVFAKGADAAAIEAGFTSVSFDPIDAATFTFTPPPGATVREATDLAHTMPAGDAPSPSDVRAFGRGFELRLAYRLDAPVPKEIEALLPYAGPLASAVVVDRGDHAWLVVGFVDVGTLQKDAATLP